MVHVEGLTGRCSERLAASVPRFYEIPPSTRSDAPPRQPSLILFSLDADAQSCDVILAAAYRCRLGHIRCSPDSRICGSAFGVEFRSNGAGTRRIHTCDLWLRVPISGISAFHRTRVGAPGSRSCYILYSCGSGDFVFSHGLSAIAVAFYVTFRPQPLDWCMRACRRSHATGFPLGCASSR
jgi:hypothetical protein